MKRFFRCRPIIRLVLLTIAIICTYFTRGTAGAAVFWPVRALPRRRLAGNCRPRTVLGRAKPATPATAKLSKNSPRPHKGLSCETCHGPSRAHVDDPEIKLPSSVTANACGATKPVLRGPHGSSKSPLPNITPAKSAPNVMCLINPTKSHE